MLPKAIQACLRDQHVSGARESTVLTFDRCRPRREIRRRACVTRPICLSSLASTRQAVDSCRHTSIAARHCPVGLQESLISCTRRRAHLHGRTFEKLPGALEEFVDGQAELLGQCRGRTFVGHGGALGSGGWRDVYLAETVTSENFIVVQGHACMKKTT